MTGIRLHHPSLSSCTFVVELEQDFASRQPRRCPLCSTDARDVLHDRKSVHLRLDSGGDVIVSPEVLASLQTVFLAGMEIVNEIENPPAQVIGAVERPKLHIVDHRLNSDHNAAPSYRKGRTKYESRDRLREGLRRAVAPTKEAG